MIFNVRPLTDADYETILVPWWKEWGWEPPAIDFLPDDGRGGILVLDGQEHVCAGFMYVTNSKVAWVDWIISSKSYRKKPERAEAISFLVDTLTNICKDMGHKYVYALIKHPGLIETYKELGYVKGDGYVGEMIKVF